MPTFSRRSQAKLATCHPALQALCGAVIAVFDFTILEGTRPQARQDYLYRIGRSKVRWPNSKHNAEPSRAVDVAPYPIDWADVRRFDLLAGFMLATAAHQGVGLRWGGDWNGDHNPHNDAFQDLLHFELLD